MLPSRLLLGAGTWGLVKVYMDQGATIANFVHLVSLDVHFLVLFMAGSMQRRAAINQVKRFLSDDAYVNITRR